MKFCIEYLRTSIRTFEAEIAKKIRTSRLSEKKGVLIKKQRKDIPPLLYQFTPFFFL